MKRAGNFPTWLLWLWRYGFTILSACLLGGMLLIILFGLRASRQLEDIEERLAFRPPPQYQPPDLERLAADEIAMSSLAVRNRVYVPVYSHVYYGQGRPYGLETTLSIRNVDRDRSIFLTSVEYYDTDGNLAQTFVDRPVELKPLKTIDFLIEVSDTTGGSGANFLVDWSAREQVDRPLVESVMVGTSGTQAVCFSRTGIELGQDNAIEQP